MSEDPKPYGIVAAQQVHGAAFYNAVVKAYDEARSHGVDPFALVGLMSLVQHRVLDERAEAMRQEIDSEV